MRHAEKEALHLTRLHQQGVDGVLLGTWVQSKAQLKLLLEAVIPVEAEETLGIRRETLPREESERAAALAAYRHRLGACPGNSPEELALPEGSVWSRSA